MSKGLAGSIGEYKSYTVAIITNIINFSDDILILS